MSEKIGRRPPGPPRTAARRPSDVTDPGAPKGAGEVSTGKGQGITDRFERQQSGITSSQLGSQLQSLATRAPPGKIQFTNEDLAYLANTFAALIRQHPKANRSKRAKMFTKAILKGHKKLGKLLEKVPQEEAEKLFDSIGEALDQSPVFAQMVDHVTDEASKLNG
jgi:hypothetical protein